MSKADQYATNDNKTFIRLRNVNVKKIQISLYKAITQTKKFGKGKQEWEHAHFESEMRHQKLTTPTKGVGMV